MIYLINTSDLNTSLVINYNRILNAVGYNYKEILNDFIINHSTKDDFGYDVVNISYINNFKSKYPVLFNTIMDICKVKRA